MQDRVMPTYHHVKKLTYTVNIRILEPRFGNMLLEQFGGRNAKIDYERAINFCDGPGTKDALQLLMIREFTHVRQI